MGKPRHREAKKTQGGLRLSMMNGKMMEQAAGAAGGGVRVFVSDAVKLVEGPYFFPCSPSGLSSVPPQQSTTKRRQMLIFSTSD